jgi:hypothetical protein
MNPCSYDHLFFDKGEKTYNGKKAASSTSLLGKLDICRKLKIYPCCHPVQRSTQSRLRTLISDLKT